MNPTGGVLRVDAGGNGHFGALRTKTVGDKTLTYTHDGMDVTCTPGQDYRSPCTGRIARLAYPYKDDLKYRGFVIECKRASLMIFYVVVNQDLLGRMVHEGDVIGTCQDISLKYPGSGVTPHWHIRVIACDPMILFGPDVITIV